MSKYKNLRDRAKTKPNSNLANPLESGKKGKKGREIQNGSRAEAQVSQ